MAGPAKEIIDRLSVDCKEGGSFYVCQNKPVQFVGCCTLDPCKTNDGNCPTESLRNTTFNKLYYSQFKAQNCLSNDPKDIFYTCAETNPPFMGCCAQNPCQASGCAAANLSSAVLSKNKENASVFLPSESDTKSQRLSPGATAGIAIGAVVVGLILIVLGLMWFRRRARANGSSPSSQQPTWMGLGTAASPPLGHYTNINAPYNSISPYNSPPMSLQQQRQSSHWQSPSMGSMNQFQGPYDNRGLLGPSSSGHLPGSILNDNADGWHGQQQQTVVQELPPQHGVVELPEQQIADRDSPTETAKNANGSTNPSAKSGTGG